MPEQMDGPLDGRGLPLIGQDAARELLAVLQDARGIIAEDRDAYLDGVALHTVNGPDPSSLDAHEASILAGYDELLARIDAVVDPLLPRQRLSRAEGR